MGDVLVSGLVKEVVGRLTSLALEEFGLLRGLEDDISSLKKDFERIEAVLQDAQEKHIKERTVELWLRELRSASLEVENVLDDVSTEVLLQRLHKRRGLKYRVRAFFSSNHNKFMSRVRIAHKVKDLRRKLDGIASKRFELKLTPSGAISNVDDLGVAGEMPDRETSSLIHDSSTIFGRNKEIEMITHTICNKDIGKHDNGEIRVYGIWSMGGTRKTTLVQLVYNHQMVNEYFELKCWVYVSEKFKVREIIKRIITSIDKSECTLTPLEMLQITLKDKLREKKFLIVLDDVWIEEDEKAKWDELSKTLSCGIEGSIVLMTTRSNRTSQMMAKVDELQHKLKCLSKEDSWLLFKKFAFAQGRERDDICELEPIGREMVEKCKGLPLAVKTLGSLMWSKKSTIDWEHVKSNNIWELHENNILPALKLSYDNLLPHLKRCFAYCCLFPKGYELEKNEVVPLWLSNSFIPPRGEISPYYLGEEIFDCLVWRSFFQVYKEKYIMHDLMHDMARHMMGGDCLVIEPSKEVIVPNEVLHLSAKEVIVSNEVLHLSSSFLLSHKDLRKLTSLRTMLILRKLTWTMFRSDNIYDISQIFNQMYIRALYLTRMRLTTLPGSICKLKHLRYLNLSMSHIQVLPESIIYLQNLQVLLLFGCSKLCKLPEGLRYMTNLQHLDINNCRSLHHLPSGVKKLTSLRMLSKFPVGNKNGAKIGELGDLNLLERKLVIQGLENVGGLNEAESANLKCKRYLSVLELWWTHRESSHLVLNGLEPNSCLEKLRIYFYMGNTISPSWIVKLSNLVEITFHGCKNCLSVPALGRLPKLSSITMMEMDSLTHFHDDDNKMLDDTANVFPSLKKLYIYKCSSLVSLPCNLPKLEVLHIFKCANIVSLPCNLPKLEVLNIDSCWELVSLPFNLPKLEVLHISYCGELVSLPSIIPNIRKLDLNQCSCLVSLPCDLSKLEVLNIFYCANIVSLPKVSHIPSISIKL